jgi:hypothetical protein
MHICHERIAITTVNDVAIGRVDVVDDNEHRLAGQLVDFLSREARSRVVAGFRSTLHRG